MISKILFIINVLVIIQIKTSSCNYSQRTCLIRSFKYSNEYLYASNNIFTGEILQIQNPSHNIYTIPLESVDIFGKLKWIIQKSNQTFTIKSNKDEYLCSSNLHHDVFRKRRRIYLKGNNKNNYKVSQKCKWRLEQINDLSFIVWNDYFNEPLYSPSFFYKYNSIKRYVYLWKNKVKSSSEFRWFIDCDSISSFMLIN